MNYILINVYENIEENVRASRSQGKKPSHALAFYNTSPDSPIDYLQRGCHSQTRTLFQSELFLGWGNNKAESDNNTFKIKISILNSSIVHITVKINFRVTFAK